MGLAATEILVAADDHVGPSEDLALVRHDSHPAAHQQQRDRDRAQHPRTLPDADPIGLLINIPTNPSSVVELWQFNDATGVLVRLCTDAMSVPRGRHSMALSGDMAVFVSHRFGVSWDDAAVLKMARQGIDAEREFNRRAGFDREDDRLPAWLVNEALPLPDGPSRFDISPEDLDRVWNEG